MKEFDTDDKIQYRLFDKKGKEHWFNGVIHGIRRYEEGGIIMRITYLVDTGRNTRVDEFPFDHRDRELTRQINEHIDKGVEPLEAIDKVIKKDDLPKSKLDVERIRQPEQIELPPEHIRAV